MKTETLTVYFDGLCVLCSREIEHYRRRQGSEKIHFVDITSSEFDATSEGLDPKAVHRHLHARDGKGNLHVGVDAFIEIWSRLPAWNWAASVASVPAMRKLLGAGYELFVRVRPMLPRKSCESSPYCDARSKI